MDINWPVVIDLIGTVAALIWIGLLTQAVVDLNKEIEKLKQDATFDPPREPKP